MIWKIFLDVETFGRSTRNKNQTQIETINITRNNQQENQQPGKTPSNNKITPEDKPIIQNPADKNKKTKIPGKKPSNKKPAKIPIVRQPKIRKSKQTETK